jgi:hypothetical protein
MIYHGKSTLLFMIGLAYEGKDDRQGDEGLTSGFLLLCTQRTCLSFFVLLILFYTFDPSTFY